MQAARRHNSEEIAAAHPADRSRPQISAAQKAIDPIFPGSPALS
jgi:hypothetical protein